METKVAVIGIIVENLDSVPELNSILSEYGESIVGRMGIPYHKKHVNLISIVIDAEEDVINALSGKIGKLDGVYSNIAFGKM